MKATVSFLAIFLFSVSAFAQRTLIVDNTGSAPTGDHVYSDLQEAIDASEEGDIIQVVPSPTLYGNPIISMEKKNISIVGGGYNSDAVFNSIVGSVTIQGDNVSLAGLSINGTLSITHAEAQTPKVNNVVIRNSRVNALTISQASNIVFSSCFFLVETSNIGFDISTAAENVVIANSILSYHFRNLHNTTINNSIIFNPFNRNIATGLTGNRFVNNVLLIQFPSTSSSLSSNENNQYINNFSRNDPSIGINGNSGSNNIIDSNATLESIFIQNGNGWYQQFNPNLQEGSALIGAGSDGTDLGVFGGGSSYSRTGVSLPTINELIAPLTVKLGSSPEVTIKASGN